jgi:hypothetical protein
LSKCDNNNKRRKNAIKMATGHPEERDETRKEQGRKEQGRKEQGKNKEIKREGAPLRSNALYLQPSSFFPMTGSTL